MKMRKHRFTSKKRKHIPTKYLLLVLSFVCVISIFTGLVFNISGGPLSAVAGYVFVPMQTGINNIGQWTSKKVNNFKTLSEVLEENEELKKQIDDLTNELTVSRMESYEVDNYREILKLDELYPGYEKIAASVVASDNNNWFDVFTINRGSNSGIKVGMNVLAGSGLAGIVISVSPNFATVRSVIDDANNVSAMVTTTGDNFNVSGNLQLMKEDQVITFSELRDTKGKVSIGDPVVTSYVSDQYEQGILIGYINSIEENSNGLTKSGTITPVVDFEHIQTVLVILNVKETSE